MKHVCITLQLSVLLACSAGLFAECANDSTNVYFISNPEKDSHLRSNALENKLSEPRFSSLI
jgi:hypothetical protein